ncbi:MAG TPA: Wzz/FepE/Etk N-terminal domain-containing protein [Stellaceae bacterium]|nr:Wzz/FepE/Etk N-terminal domain-containing protein [Stellaceae bacterium]
MPALQSSRGLLTAAFRRTRLFLGIVLAVNLLTIVYLLIVTPEFESTAQLLFRFGPDRRPTVESKGDGGSSDVSVDERTKIIQSNIDILASRDMAEKLLNALTVLHVYPEIVADPPNDGTVMDAAVTKLQHNLSVKLAPAGDVIRVTFAHPDARIAAETTGRLVSLFLTQQGGIFTNPQAPFLEGQVRDAEKKLNASRQALNQYMTQAKLAAVDEELSSLVKRRADAAGQLTLHTAARADAEAKRTKLQDTLKHVPQDQPVAVESDLFRPLDEAQEKLRDLRNKRQQLLRSYDSENRLVKDVDQDIAFAARDAAEKETQLQHRVKATPSPVYQTLETADLQDEAAYDAEAAQVAVYTDELTQIDKQLADLRDRKNGYDDLNRQVQLDTDNLKTLTTRYDDAKVADNMNRANITNVDEIEHPVVAAAPTKPNRSMVLALGFCASLALGLAACLSRERSNERFSLPEEITSIARLPVLAVFPDMGRLPKGMKALGKPPRQLPGIAATS